ncbi:hypothetical protein QBC43DRAFT_26872 [Cladorrhinum sp. PSN259]|nr:hypothetical protein QBC43DRAFT_26872 [Cladorrhinum sp. PSN259]
MLERGKRQGKVSRKYRVVATIGGFADVGIWTMRECKSLQYAISTSWLHSAPEVDPPHPEACVGVWSATRCSVLCHLWLCSSFHCAAQRCFCRLFFCLRRFDGKSCPLGLAGSTRGACLFYGAALPITECTSEVSRGRMCRTACTLLALPMGHGPFVHLLHGIGFDASSPVVSIITHYLLLCPHISHSLSFFLLFHLPIATLRPGRRSPCDRRGFIILTHPLPFNPLAPVYRIIIESIHIETVTRHSGPLPKVVDRTLKSHPSFNPYISPTNKLRHPEIAPSLKICDSPSSVLTLVEDDLTARQGG